MSVALNEYQQAVGASMPDWTVRTRPQRVTLEGRYCRLEPLDAQRHASELYQAYAPDQDSRDWTYLVAGPFADAASYRAYAESAAASLDPLHYAVIDLRSGRAVGTLALMRIDPANGVIEVGNVVFSSDLKRTPVSTEAQYLLMKYAFETLGYRRYEWKCDSLNAPSRQAAARLGFQYEGIFRQAVVYKNRNRDTAWFAIIDQDWPTLRSAFDAWLKPDNFNQLGGQRQSLVALREAAARHVVQTRPAVTVSALTAADHAAWHTLWQAYQTFYQVQLSEAVFQTTWERLLDPAEPMFVLGAFNADRQLVGLVHALYHRSSWTQGQYCYLQDLFTTPESRGLGVGRALIEAVYAQAQQAGARRVYWLTHETNTTARALYDKLANNGGFIQYRKDLQ